MINLIEPSTLHPTPLYQHQNTLFTAKKIIFYEIQTSMETSCLDDLKRNVHLLDIVKSFYIKIKVNVRSHL